MTFVGIVMKSPETSRNWLEENKNQDKIIEWQAIRQTLVEDALTGRRDRDECRMMISAINKRIERLYLEGV